MLFSTSAAMFAALGAVGVLMGGLTIALPAALTKTCALASHTCNTLTAPTLGALAVGLMAVSVGMIVYRNKMRFK